MTVRHPSGKFFIKKVMAPNVPKNINQFLFDAAAQIKKWEENKKCPDLKHDLYKILDITI